MKKPRSIKELREEYEQVIIEDEEKEHNEVV